MTPRQAEAAQFVREFHETKGYGPSVRDVARWLGVSSAAAHKQLTRLRESGAIQSDPGTARSLRPADGG